MSGRLGWLLCAALFAALACGVVRAAEAVPLPFTKGTVAGFIDFTPRGTQPGLTHALLDAESCSGCHSGAADEQHLPYPGWAGSMMANAARDPLFWAALDVANRDGADNGAEGIGDYCLRCHVPQGWYVGRVRKLRDVVPANGVDTADVIDGFDGCKLNGRHDFSDFDNDYGGLSCQFCHRVTDSGPLGQPTFLENADLWLDDTDCNGRGEPCRAGPYRYPYNYVDAMGNPRTYNGAPHASKHSPLHSDSAMCGTCHDVTTPMLESGPFRTLIVADGTPDGRDTGLPFPAERTYSEWLQSDHARVLFRDGLEPENDLRIARGETCQGCHMPQAQPPANDPTRTLHASSVGSPPRNGNLPTHEFAGGNHWVPALLKGEFPNIGRSEDFDRTIAAAQRLLTEESASVSSQATLTAAGGGASTLSLTARVTNHTGHKLPSGYAEGRRMWLAVEVRDAANAVVWRSGQWDAATGALAVDAQTKIYEIKQGIWNDATGTCVTVDGSGRERFHFVLNDCIAKDNRIPPAGFRGANDPETAAYGYTYASAGAGVSSHHDLTQYSVPVPAGTPLPLSVTTTLRYQVASREYIEFLRNQAVERGFVSENALCAGEPGRPFPVGPAEASRGQYVFDLWNDPAYGKSPPVDMASATIAVAP